MAALIGTFVPIILDKKRIDPAIATGPFITTSNDILGIYLFFIISEFNWVNYVSMKVLHLDSNHSILLQHLKILILIITAIITQKYY